MVWALLLVTLTACVLAFFLGMKLQKHRSVEEHIERMEQIRLAEVRARDGIEKKLNELAEIKTKLGGLHWDDLLEEIKL